jgi:colanic acid/amylovoran biosynthesis glycosyltransferase
MAVAPLSSIPDALGRRVAYLLNQYPMVSQTFIRREIRELERQGFIVERMAVRGWDVDLVDADDLQERSRTRYLLRGGMVQLLLSVAKVALRRPLPFARACLAALRLSRSADRPLPYHAAYLAEACLAFEWLQASKCDHVHAHFGTNSAEVALLTHILGGPPYSFTVHGPDEFDRGVYLHLDEKIKRSKFVVAVNSFCRSQMFRRVDRSSWPKIKVVHCGLDQDYTDTPATEPRQPPQFVCVGRLSEQKGQLLLLEAFHRIAGTFDCHLVLAGDGEMRRELEERIRTLGLQARVTITGWLTGDEVRRAIQGARVFVLPSFAESLPVVIMEAMALRRPVISTYVAGIPELVLPGATGWLVPAGSVDQLAAAMAESLTLPAEAMARMGEAGRKRVVERHSIEQEARKLAHLISTNSVDAEILEWQA